MSVLSHVRGGSRIKVWLFFLLLFLAIHVAVKVVPMYMDYESMEDTMDTKASVAQVLTDDQILTDLVNKAKELGLPLTADSFIIDRNQDTRTMAIRTKYGWDVDVTFLWGAYKRTFHFSPSVKENIMNVTL